AMSPSQGATRRKQTWGRSAAPSRLEEAHQRLALPVSIFHRQVDQVLSVGAVEQQVACQVCLGDEMALSNPVQELGGKRGLSELAGTGAPSVRRRNRRDVARGP